MADRTRAFLLGLSVGTALTVGITLSVLERPAPRLAPPPGPGEAPAARPAAPSPGPGPPAAPRSAALADLERQLADLKAENALLQKMLDDALRAERGAPLPWPEALPPAFSPEGFAGAVAAAIEACDPGVELVDVACEEPPCFALLRPRAEGWYRALVEDCPAWTAAFPRKGPQYFWDIDCEGGPQQAAAIGWSVWDVPELEPKDHDSKDNFGRRVLSRAATIRDEFPCE